MNAEMLETLGKIAGIGGICVGVALIVFHKVISESILGTMGRERAYRLVRLVTLCVWTIALAGISAWILTEAPGNNGDSADKPGIETRGDQSPVVQGTGGDVRINIGTGGKEKKGER